MPTGPRIAVAMRPCARARACPPPMNNPLRTAPLAVRSRSPRSGKARRDGVSFASGTARATLPCARVFALLTVAHNSRPQLDALLRSVERHAPGTRVVVVDSGSSDGSADAARGWSNASVIELGENVGFGRANNAGIAEIDEPVTVLVNPDVELLDGSVADLAEEASRP